MVIEIFGTGNSELGGPHRTHREIGQAAWGGLQALVYTKVKDGSLGAGYPAARQGGQRQKGTNEMMLRFAIHAEIPGLPFRPWASQANELPDTIRILELMEFCWRNIGHPIPTKDNSDTIYDIEMGRRNFRKDVNRIFSRNKLAYTLTADGMIERLVQPTSTK